MSMTTESKPQGGYVHQGTAKGDAHDNERRGSQIRIALLAEKANLEKADQAIANLLAAAKLGYGILKLPEGADLGEVKGYQQGHEIVINLEQLRMANDEVKYKQLVLDLFKALSQANVEFAEVNRQGQDALFNCVDGITLPITYSDPFSKCADVQIKLADLSLHGITVADVAKVHQQVVNQQQARVDAADKKVAELVGKYRDLTLQANAYGDLMKINNLIRDAKTLPASTYELILHDMTDALAVLEDRVDANDKVLAKLATDLVNKFKNDESYTSDLNKFAAVAKKRLKQVTEQLMQHPHIESLLKRAEGLGDDELTTPTVARLALQFATVNPSFALEIMAADAELHAEQEALAAIKARHVPDLAGLKADIDAIEADYEQDRLALITAPTGYADKGQVELGKAISATKEAQKQLLASIKPLYEHLAAAAENASEEDNYALEMVVDLTRKLLKDPTNADLHAKYRQVAEEAEGHPTLGANIAKAMLTFAGVALAVGSAAALVLAAPAVLGTTALTVGAYTITNAGLAYTGVAAGTSTALAGRYFLGQRCGTSRDMVDVAENVSSRTATIQA